MTVCVALSGRPASGKTTIAAALAQRLNGVNLDTDLVTGPLRDCALAALGLPVSAVDDPFYQQQLRPGVYQSLLDTAARVVECGIPAVIDAPFHPGGFTDTHWDRFSDMLTAVGGTLIRIHVNVSDAVARARMTSRGEPRDDNKLRNWGTHSEVWTFPLPEGVAVVRNDGTTGDVEDVVEQCLAGIAAHSGHVQAAAGG